jgi:molybdenum cofactor cytidylyltransferase
MIAGLILAAGESSRMNSPKALLQIHGKTFVEHISEQMARSGVDPVCVVAGAHFAEIRNHFGLREEFSIIHNLKYSQGQLSSLKEGLRQLPTGSEAAMVWPVDLPLVHVNTVKAIVQAFKQSRKAVVIPSMNGRHGHPVIYGTPAIGSIFTLKGDRTAKDVRTLLKDDVFYVEVSDPGVLIDIDTPEDYRKHVLNG